jgi:DNA damage-inducible protein 1
MIESGVDDPGASTSGSSNSTPQPARTSGDRSAGTSSSSFPGGGNTLGSAPTPRTSTRPAAAQSRHPDSAIELIMGLGVSREVAISMLDAAGGNVDAAASLLF